MPTTKKRSTRTSAKIVSNVANKAAKETYNAVESTRSSARNVAKIGTKAMQDFMATGAGEAQKAQDKILAVGREGAAKLAKSADAASKALYEAVSLSRDNLETCLECGNMTAELAKDMGSELVEFANKSFADNVELSKEFLTCRTLSDMMDLQNRMIKQSIDNFFNQSVRLSSMLFEYSSEALEPINERVAQATEQFSKKIAA